MAKYIFMYSLRIVQWILIFSWSTIFILMVYFDQSMYDHTDDKSLFHFFNGEMKFNINETAVELLFKKEGRYKSESIGKWVDFKGKPTIKASENYIKAIWANEIQLILNGSFKVSNNSNVYSLSIKWIDPKSFNRLIENCWNMNAGNWFGGSAMGLIQPWPIQNMPFRYTSFVPHLMSGVAAPFFLSSESFYLFVKPENPLFVSIKKDKTLCFKSEFVSPYRNTDNRHLSLDYELIVFEPANMTAAWLHFISTVGKPEIAPSFDVIQNPIWSTWVTYKKDINQTSVIDFATQIHERGFPVNQIEIDDNWEKCYGQEEFDSKKFTNPTAMLKRIKNFGYKITLWVHPFVNTECSVFSEGLEMNYFVTDRTGTALISPWWNGRAAGHIDVTNPHARTWWSSRLSKLKSIGIDSFKFDAGEASFIGAKGYLHADESFQPGIYSTDYVKFAKNFGNRVETRVGYGSQNQGGGFLRLFDRLSNWGLDNGLHSVIISTLHYGILGYPFVIPDYIGGNAYHTWPDKELFIRWMELNAFLPVMQFSILPWSYDEEVTNVANKMIALHQNISNVFRECVDQALQYGSPIIRPLWWINPSDEISQTINDQFLVGSSFLVAPVVTKGATSRNIYIPPGTWVDMLRGGQLLGPKWLNDYKVALDEIAYFKNAEL